MEAVPFKDMYTKLATAVESGDVPDIMHELCRGSVPVFAGHDCSHGRCN